MHTHSNANTPAGVLRYPFSSTMPSNNLPSPPSDDHKPAMSRKPLTSGLATKSLKTIKKPPVHRISKRASSTVGLHHDHIAHGIGIDGRHKRVWKACERCRMKKTKCDGEFPCKRCKDDGLVCAAGVRKKMEYKQLPKGYAEVLENSQLALIATVHKLYSMVRNHQEWDLGEPELNDHGEPVIHDIAQRLGCIRPNSDIDLPVHSVFPEDETGLADLARQLEEQQRQEAEASKKFKTMRSHGSATYHHTDRASSSDLDYSDIEFGYRRTAFGSHDSSRSTSSSNAGNTSGNNPHSNHSHSQSHNSPHPLHMSPQNFSANHDYDLSTLTPTEQTTSAGPFPSPIMTGFPEWAVPKTQLGAEDLTAQFLRQPGLFQGYSGMSRNVMDTTYNIVEPNMLNASGNPVLMMGLPDSTIYEGYDEESMRL